MTVSSGLRTSQLARPAGERIYRIVGGSPLNGSVRIGGAKNAALPMLAATLLTSEPVVLNDVPNLADIDNMIEILRSLGAEVEWDRAKRKVTVRAESIHTMAVPPELVERMRASFLVSGPLLARFGEFDASVPGGCQLGARPVDVDMHGFRQMGAEVLASEESISAKAEALHGARIFMDYPSHTGTENLLMAATLAEGTMTITNASCEPEIVALGAMLNRMGARISGLGSPYITVEGVARLRGVSETILPDRLEAGTYAVAAVVTGGKIVLENVRSSDMLPVTSKLRDAGASVWQSDSSMLVEAGISLNSIDIQTLPFPGFPTDLQAPFAVLMTQAKGTSKLKERIFDDRLRYTDELARMGANVAINKYSSSPGKVSYGNEVTITGPTKLHGAEVRALDIRAGAGVVIAGLVAEGETTITDVKHMDRGYDGLVEKLRSLGATIEEGTKPAS